MRYPRLCNWILFRKNEDGSYEAKNCISKQKYTLGSTIAYFARQLDGRTDPYSILPDYPRHNVKEMLDELEEVNFLRYGNILEKSKGSIIYALVIPNKTRTDSLIPTIFNYILLTLWLPTFLLGVSSLLSYLPDLDGGSDMLGRWGGLICGAFLHECSHAASVLCYSGRVFTAGVLIHHYMPGAYVMIDDSSIKSRLRKVQVSAAGVEMNIFLSGMALILCSGISSQSAFFFGFAMSNLCLALLNLTFYEGLDGMAMMEKLLGIDAIIARAKYSLSNKDEFQRLITAGPHGVAEISICALLVILQGGIPALYLLCLMEVVECFI